MKNFFLYLIISVLSAGSVSAGIMFTKVGFVLSGDTLKINKGNYRQQDSEIIVYFNESDIAPLNVRIIFNELFRQYSAVKDALVYNNSSLANINALKLLEDMKSMTNGIDVLNKDDRWLMFINNYENIRRKIESATFISDQRFLFNEISVGMMKFIKQFGLSDKTVYLMQCATDTPVGNALWLTDSRDTKNPYLGLQNDTTCAKVKEVWKFK